MFGFTRVCMCVYIYTHSLTHAYTHRFSIINSVVIVVFLAAMIAAILMKAVNGDIARYNQVCFVWMYMYACMHVSVNISFVHYLSEH
jgi:hypothetical protein